LASHEPLAETPYGKQENPFTSAKPADYAIPCLLDGRVALQAAVPSVFLTPSLWHNCRRRVVRIGAAKLDADAFN